MAFLHLDENRIENKFPSIDFSISIFDFSLQRELKKAENDRANLPAYVLTWQAKLCFPIFSTFVLKVLNSSHKRNEFFLMKKHFSVLLITFCSFELVEIPK